MDRYPRAGFWWILAAVLVGAVIEMAYWPLHDYPGALWHTKPRGDDVEIVHQVAASAGWREIWGYWTGPNIHGIGFYRPLSSTLFVLEHRLWGDDDRPWHLISLLAHGGVVAMFFWVAVVWFGGRPSERLLKSAGAAACFSWPWLADRVVQKWVIGWWPAQPESLSLLFGLAMLGCVLRGIEFEDRRWFWPTPMLFLISIGWKEMGYCAGVGACLLLLRKRQWWWLTALSVLGTAAFMLRKLALGPIAKGLNQPERIPSEVYATLMDRHYRLLEFIPIVPGLVVAVGWYIVRHPRIGKPAASVTAGLIFAGSYLMLVGLPDGPYWFVPLIAAASLALSAVWWIGLPLAARRWPVPETWLLYALSTIIAWGFPPVFAWYRYWPECLGSLLVVEAALALKNGPAVLTVSPRKQSAQLGE